MLNYNKHYRSNLINHIHSKLPINEFISGNFSKAGEIIDGYNELLKQCFEEAKNTFLGGKEINEYIADELKKILEERERLENEKSEIVNKLEEKNNFAKELRKEVKGNKQREAIREAFQKFEFDTEKFDNFIDRLKTENPENYKRGEEMIVRFLNSSNYKKIREDKISNPDRSVLKIKRDNLTRKLSHKSNGLNLDNKIKRIKNGKYKRELESSIEDSIIKYFGKRTDFVLEEDTRDLKTIYMDTITSEMILNKNIKKRLRDELIKKHGDKVGLRNNIIVTYKYLKRKEIDIRTRFQISSMTNFEDEMINLIMLEIKDNIKSIKENYYTFKDILPDEDIVYLESKLRGEKKQLRNMEILTDEKSFNIFRTLRDYLEDSDLEYKFEDIRNYSFQGLESDCKSLEEILTTLVKSMNKEDLESLRNHEGSELIEKYINSENIVNTQLKLLF